MNKILVLGAIGAMGLSAATVGAAVANNNALEASQVNAESTLSEGDKIYLKLHSDYWGSAKAYYSMHFWGGNGSTAWPGLKLGSGSGSAELSYTLSSEEAALIGGYTHVIIVRWSGSDYGTEWNRWDYFGNSHAMEPEEYNYFTNNSYDSCKSAKVPEESTYCYYSPDSALEPTNIYYWGGHPDGPAWPGAAFTDVATKIEGVTFDGGKDLYRLTFPSQIKNFIVKGADSQSGNINFVEGSFYAPYNATSYLDGDAEKGAAAALIEEIADAYSASAGYDYDGTHYEHSICSFTEAQATSFNAKYKALGAERGKAAFEAATLNAVAFSDIMGQLATNYPSLGSGSLSIGSLSNIDNSILALGLVSAASLVGISGLVVASKKKKKA